MTELEEIIILKAKSNIDKFRYFIIGFGVCATLLGILKLLHIVTI